MQSTELIPHLFRTEYRKLCAVLCKRLGMAAISQAEDIVGDTFLQAMETWTYKGLPEQPKAWLYAVAKNKAINYLLRTARFTDKVAPAWLEGNPLAEESVIDLGEQNIQDSQSQMLFALCHPAISVEAQIGLSLRILCGFGIDEIATAFLTAPATISKRLQRAKDKLKQVNAPVAFPDVAELQPRLESVLTTIYLLFNEGYYSECQDQILRKDLCLEAMRLTQLLLQEPRTAQPEVHALLALMCFHASRFSAREQAMGELVLYSDQDESHWDQGLIAQGCQQLHLAAQGDRLTHFHLEAMIAYWHTQKADTAAKWEPILKLYNTLMELRPSPIVALNRAVAISKVEGPAAAIAAAEPLALHQNPYWHTLMGHLYQGTDWGRAHAHLQAAYGCARTRADRAHIARQIAELEAHKGAN